MERVFLIRVKCDATGHDGYLSVKTDNRPTSFGVMYVRIEDFDQHKEDVVAFLTRARAIALVDEIRASSLQKHPTHTATISTESKTVSYQDAQRIAKASQNGIFEYQSDPDG